MKKIDIHMIDSGQFPENAAAQIKKIDHPLIQIQKGEYVQNNIREARRRSYSKGTCPYVSWIDDDDEVMDISWIDYAVKLLDNNPAISAVYPRYEIWNNGKYVRTLPVQEPWKCELHMAPTPVAHHLTIMRREHVAHIHEMFAEGMEFSLRSADQFLTQGMLRFGVLQPVLNVAYRWKLRPNSASKWSENYDARTWAHRFTADTFKLHRQLHSA